MAHSTTLDTADATQRPAGVRGNGGNVGRVPQLTPSRTASAASHVSTTETQSSSCSLSPLSSCCSCSWSPPVPPSNGDESLHAGENTSAPVVASTRPARNRTVCARVEGVMTGQSTRNANEVRGDPPASVNRGVSGRVQVVDVRSCRDATGQNEINQRIRTGQSSNHRRPAFQVMKVRHLLLVP